MRLFLDMFSAQYLNGSPCRESSSMFKQCGAHIVQPPTDMPFGERVYTARDPAGHWWTFSLHIADVAPEEWGAKTAGGD